MLKWILAICFLSVLVLCLFVPIYIDEVGWKIISSRMGLEGGHSISLYPQCTSSFLQSIPVWLKPARYLDSFLYEDLSHPIKLRILGCCFFVLVILLCLFLLSSFQGMGTLAMIFLGVLPFGMVLNRPESSLLVCLILLILLSRLKFKTPFLQIVGGLSFCVLSALFLSQHPKALFFLPLLLTLGCFVGKNLPSRIVLGWVVLSIGWGSVNFYKRALVCPENSYVEKINSQVMLSPEQLLNEPKEAVKQLIRNAFRFKEYLYPILFSEAYMYEWLPPLNIHPTWKTILNRLIKFAFVSWIGMGLLFLGLNLVKEASWWRNDRIVASVGIYLGVLGINFFQTTRHFYESDFILPLLVTASGVLMTTGIDRHKKVGFLAKQLSLGCIAISLLSMGTLLYYFYPIAMKDWLKGGYLINQKYSFSAFNRKSEEMRVQQLAEKCQLQNRSIFKHVVLDDFTYTFFWKTREPYHAHYVMQSWGKGIADKLKFLAEKESSGLICHCRFIDSELIPLVTREGELCCISAFN